MRSLLKVAYQAISLTMTFPPTVPFFYLFYGSKVSASGTPIVVPRGDRKEGLLTLKFWAYVLLEPL
jgi:hypothetical protein